MNKSGYVYVIALGFSNLYKIGISINPESRLLALRAANPKAKITMAYYFNDAKSEERFLHKRYFNFRIERELYRLTKTQLREIELHISDAAGGLFDIVRNRKKERAIKPKSTLIFKDTADQEAQVELKRRYENRMDELTWSEIGNELGVNRGLVWRVYYGKVKSNMVRRALGMSSLPCSCAKLSVSGTNVIHEENNEACCGKGH